MSDDKTREAAFQHARSQRQDGKIISRGEERALRSGLQVMPDPLPIDDKYKNVLLPFLRSMNTELHANAGKGDRPGWLSLSREQVMLEIFYHASKLQKAMKDDDPNGIREYSADVANMAMMALDICGGLPDPDEEV